MDLARSVQEVTEEVMLRLSRTLHRETGVDYLCMAGGVALNCVGNGRILREGPFKGLWIQPAAGDAGGALGAALTAWHQFEQQPRKVIPGKDSLKGSYLGPAHTNEEIETYLKKADAPYVHLSETSYIPVWPKNLQQGRSWGGFRDVWNLALVRWVVEHFGRCPQSGHAVGDEPEN